MLIVSRDNFDPKNATQLFLCYLSQRLTAIFYWTTISKIKPLFTLTKSFIILIDYTKTYLISRLKRF